jgi:hypothetical protein
VTNTKPGGGAADGGEKRASRRDRQREARMRRSGGSSGRIALVLAIVGLVLIVLFVIPRGQGKPAELLPRSTFTTSSPINTSDPTSGKPVVPGITSVYKGYTIGHCCGPSKADWEALSAERKEAFIRGFLR